MLGGFFFSVKEIGYFVQFKGGLIPESYIPLFCADGAYILLEGLVVLWVYLKFI